MGTWFRITLAMLFACMLSCADAAYAEVVKITGGEVNFDGASVGGVAKVPGRGGVPQGEVTIGADGKASGQVRVQLAGYNTGNADRDHDMHTKYFQTDKYPQAVLDILPVKATEAQFVWTGTLKLKGDAKPVAGYATVKGDKLWAKFTLNIKDYPSLGVPKHKEILMQDEWVVTVNATLAR